MKHCITFVLALFVTLSTAGCGGGIESDINRMTSAADQMTQACASGDEEGYLAAADALTSALVSIKPKIEALPQEQRMQYAPQIAPAVLAMMDPNCLSMTMQIASGPNAARLQAIMSKMPSN